MCDHGPVLPSGLCTQQSFHKKGEKDTPGTRSHLCAPPLMGSQSVGIPQQKGHCGHLMRIHKCPCARCHPASSSPWEGPQVRWEQAGDRNRDQEGGMASPGSSSSGPGVQPGPCPEGCWWRINQPK